jgi:hypothetical protein
MRTKSEIERVLEHFSGNTCSTPAAEKAVWIAALNWVLGDNDHKRMYQNLLRHLEPEEPTRDHTARELVLTHSLLIALARLR